MQFFSVDYFPFYVIVGIPVYLLINWVLSNKKKSTIPKWLLSTSLTIILTPIIFFIVCWSFLTIMFYEPSYQFSSLQWKTDQNHRYRMLDDLIEKKKIINKDTVELKKLLGDDVSRQSNQLWYYNAGVGNGGLGIQFHFLKITFSNGKVIKAEHHSIND